MLALENPGNESGEAAGFFLELANGFKVVYTVLERFADDLTLFEELREELHAFLAEEEKSAEATIVEVFTRDRLGVLRRTERGAVPERR